MGVLRTFEQSCKSAADASQKQLLSILKDNADTEYGKKYHFSDISSVSEYKKQVPFSAGINIVEWSACADYSTSPARYLLFIETEPEIEREKKQEIRDLLDEKLAEASEYYAHYRQEKKLGPLELILLQPQTFALYRDVQVWNGASPNQLKPIHVITNPKTEAFFRGLKIST